LFVLKETKDAKRGISQYFIYITNSKLDLSALLGCNFSNIKVIFTNKLRV